MVIFQKIFFFMIKRVKISIEYDGTSYVGWQAQRNGKSIQGEIEKALKEIFKENIKLYAAGRTDAGVHSLGQIAHFDVEEGFIEEKKIHMALNNVLKKNNNKITILNSTYVNNSFHSRFSVKKKTYLYKILNRTTKSFLYEKKAWFVHENLDLDQMTQASCFLIGKYDFSAFRSSQCQAKSPIRSIQKITINKKKKIIYIRLTGKSFLHNQVRIIVGTICNIGQGKWAINKMKEILDSENRNLAGITAPPEGLYLEKIYY